MKNQPEDLNLKAPGDRPERKPTERPGGGAEMIYHERVRQIEREGYSPDHDTTVNTKGELAMAGASYAVLAGGQAKFGTQEVRAIAAPKQWPWRGAAWKPSNNPLNNLVRAGALIAAEIDRRLALGETMEEQAPAAIEAKPEGAPEA